jgi:hypothetical protein
MRRSPLTIDGLWYCLCPSFQPSYLRCPGPPFKSTRNASRRLQSSASHGASQHVDRHIRDNKAPEEYKTQTPKCVTLRFPRSHADTTENLQSLSVPALEDLLEQLSSQRRTFSFQIIDVLRVLLQKHRISPTTRHYRAYILGNIDLRCGSPGNIRSLLQEMEREGITADSATLHAALEVITFFFVQG